MTFFASLRTLNHFKTPFMIVNKLGSFIWFHSGKFLCSLPRDRVENEIVIIEIFLSLSNWLYIIKRKFKRFC